MELAGQIFGWITPVLTFFSYQCKTRKNLLIIQVLAAASICISYLLLGAWSGMALNVVCTLRNLIIYKKDLKIFSHPLCPITLTVAMGIMGALSWQGYMSLFIVLALMANTLFLYFASVQKLRWSILITSSMIAIYNVYFSVWGGVLNEGIAIASSIIGIWRFRRDQ